MALPPIMAPMRIFQFLALQRADVTARLMRASRDLRATVVLDLEDGLWDLTDEARSAELKAAGREELCKLAQFHRPLLERLSVGVRVNRISSPEAARDFEAVARAARFVEFDCIVATKIETGRDVLECVAALHGHGVVHRGVVPIVETRKGLANLDEIIDAARRAGIGWMVYGHFDFALDSGWWPFPGPAEAAFWDQVEPLIARVEAGGIGYVHPPFFQLNDERSFAAILGRLDGACTREYGVITIGTRQTALADRLREAEARQTDPGYPVLDRPHESPIALARRVAETYLANRRPGASFALDPRTGEFIPPHVYLAACNYLREEGDG
jgi:citrate lyase beta subunit